SILEESEDGVSKVISAFIPIILGGVANKSSDSKVMAKVMNLVNSTPTSGGILDNLASILGSDSGSLKSVFCDKDTEPQTSGFLNSLFGNKQNDIAEKVAHSSGIKNTSAEAIMDMVATLVIGYFAKSKQSITGINSLLSTQKNNIMAAYPSGLNLDFGKMDKEGERAAE
ncbi:MAG TPA: DUF937 domain-containing protein, partial [Chitinophagaceae bacterium]|nr:DUF937 domain-containing protein [Chitinophagaceae bacterium]